MTFSTNATPPSCHITIHDTVIKQVDEFTYLGSMLSSDGRSEAEIKKRIRIAKSAFKKMGKLLNKGSLSIKTRLNILKCYIWSTFLYRCESWTINSQCKRDWMLEKCGFYDTCARSNEWTGSRMKKC